MASRNARLAFRDEFAVCVTSYLHDVCTGDPAARRGLPSRCQAGAAAVGVGATELPARGRSVMDNSLEDLEAISLFHVWEVAKEIGGEE
jgi:hypothetical protein